MYKADSMSSVYSLVLICEVYQATVDGCGLLDLEEEGRSCGGFREGCCRVKNYKDGRRNIIYRI